MSTTDVTEDAIRLARSWLSATAEGQTAAEAPHDRAASPRSSSDPAGLELARAVRRPGRPSGRPAGRRARARRPRRAGDGRTGVPRPGRPRAAAGRRRGRTRAARASSSPPPGCACASSSATSWPTPARVSPGTSPPPARRASGSTSTSSARRSSASARRPRASRASPRSCDRPDVDYVSVKVSAVASQLSTWDTAGSRDRVVERLRPLYLTAARARHLPQPRHGGVPRPRPHDAGLRAADARPRAARRRGRHRPAGLPAGLAGGPRRAHRPRGPPPVRPAARGSRSASSRARTSRWSRSRPSCTAGRRPRSPPRPRSTRTTSGCWTARCDPSARRDVRIGVASHNLFHVALAHLTRRATAASARRSTSRCSRAWRPRRRAPCATSSAAVLLYTPGRRPRRTSTSRSPTSCAAWRRTPRAQNFLHALFAPERRRRDRRRAEDRQARRRSALAAHAGRACLGRDAPAAPPSAPAPSRSSP